MTLSATVKTRLVPLGDRLILRRIDEGHGPIRMPDADQQEQQSQECEVVTTPRNWTELHVPQVGDRVYIAKHKGYSVTTNDGEELVVVEVVDVLCIEITIAVMVGVDVDVEEASL